MDATGLEAVPAGPLGTEELQPLHAWWRACTYLAVGMIYPRDNRLLRETLGIHKVTHRLLDHWRASPALVFHLGTSAPRHQAL